MKVMEEEDKKFNRVYYVIGFVVLLLVLVFIAFYSMFYQPLSETVVKQKMELEIATKKLETIGKNFEAMSISSKKDKDLSDSLYLDWEKRINTKYEKSKKYEKDIIFIGNSSFSERIKLLSEWLDSGDSK